MKKINIFLASSNELKNEREKFEIEIYRKGKAWFNKDIFLNLNIWEDLPASVSQTRSQDEYNKFVKESEIFVMLASTKVGRYTAEEFDIAYQQFLSTKKPKFFTYFKSSEGQEDSLLSFQQKLTGLGHFPAYFSDFNDLWVQFNKELERLDMDELLKNNSIPEESKILIFNAHLTKELLTAISPYSIEAAQLLKQDGKPGWELKPNISTVAKAIIIRSYGGVLGIQLESLMSIGRNPLSEEKKKDYIENGLTMAKKSLQTISFALISSLWNNKSHANNKSGVNKEIILKDTQKDILDHFFTCIREFGVKEYFDLLKCLYLIFNENQLDFPLQPLKNMHGFFEDGSILENACEKLESIDDLLRNEQYSLWDCYETEVQLTHILVTFSFLAAYKMESIRRIEYEVMRENQHCYLHNFIDLKRDENTHGANLSLMKYRIAPLRTDAVLLSKDRYEECVNMSPFIIDINSLISDNESCANIGFYHSKGFNNDKLSYRLLDDNLVREFAFKKDTGPDIDHIDEFVIDRDKRRQLKLDNVLLQFEEAKNAILGA